jgi:hypothetical protein
MPTAGLTAYSLRCAKLGSNPVQDMGVADLMVMERVRKQRKEVEVEESEQEEM